MAHAHLGRRRPINPFHNFGSHFDEPIKHSQAERAAIISKATFTFKSELQNGLIWPDYLHDKPLYMRSLNYIFNAVWEPRKGTDKLQKSPAQEDYIVVMKRGLYFQTFCHNRSGSLSLASLIATFQSICHEPICPTSSVAVLTAADRDTWVEICSINEHRSTGRQWRRTGSRNSPECSRRKRKALTDHRQSCFHSLPRRRLSVKHNRAPQHVSLRPSWGPMERQKYSICSVQ